MTTSPNIEIPLSSNPASRSPLVRNLVLILFTASIIASIAYALYKNHQQSNQIQTLSAEAAILKQQQSSTQIRLDSTLERLDSNQATLDSRLSSVNKNLSNALQERLYQSNDWLLLKARYYLDLAEINTHWNYNSQTITALLEQADKLLANLHDPKLYAIRQAIAQDISQIQATPAIDIAGLLAKLDAAQQLLTDLPIKNPFTLTKADSVDTTPKSTPSTWREHIQNSIRRLEKLVLIRHHNESIQPLIAPEYESLFRESSLLSLQQAQWAVIQQNTKVYTLSLKQAINTIQRVFDLNDQKTKALLQQLDDLQKTQLNSQKPATGEALKLLNQLIDDKHIISTPESDLTAMPENNVKSPDAGEKP